MKRWLCFLLLLILTCGWASATSPNKLTKDELIQCFQAITPQGNKLLDYYQANVAANSDIDVIPRPGFVNTVVLSILPSFKQKSQQGFYSAFAGGTAAAEIKIYDDVDLLSAVIFFNKALLSSLASYAVKSHLNADNDNLIEEYQDTTNAELTTLAEVLSTGVDVAKDIISIASVSGGILIAVTDYTDGNAHWSAAALSVIPLVARLHLPLRAVSKTGAQIFNLSDRSVGKLSEVIDIVKQPLENFTSSAAKLLPKGLPAFRRRSAILAKIEEARVAGDLTNDQVVEFIAYLRRNFPDAMPIRGPNGSAVLQENLVKAGFPKPTGNYAAHHYAMQKYDEKFLRVGIDIHAADFGKWLERETHIGYHRNPGMPWPPPNGPPQRFDAITDDFFARNENPSREQLIQFIQQLKDAFP